MDPNDPAAALMFRKAQLLAQEQAAMGGQPPAPPMPAPPAGAMTQSQFGGYGAPRPMSPQQIQQLAALLRSR